MPGRIIHGTDKIGYAFLNFTGENPVFENPVINEGAKSISIEVEESSKAVKADNKTYAIVAGAKVKTAEMVLLQLNEEYYQRALGYKEHPNGMSTDTGGKEYHCIFFRTFEEDDQGVTPVLHYLYKVKAKEPSIEYKTDEDEIEPAELTVPLTCAASEIAKDKDGVEVQYGFIKRTQKNAKLFDIFEEAIILPTDDVSEVENG